MRFATASVLFTEDRRINRTQDYWKTSGFSVTVRILYSYKANVEYFATRLFLKRHVCMYKVIIDVKNYRLLEQNFSAWYRATRRILLQRNDHIIRCTKEHNAFVCYRFETLARFCFLNNWHLNSKLINYFFESG